MPLLQLDRADFFDRYFDYRPGEHLSLIYPTQKGKTHLAWQCLQAAMRLQPHLRAATLMPKSKSPATARWAASLGLRETPVWPPKKKLFEQEPPGWLVWPPHRMDLPTRERRVLIAEQLRKAMSDLYAEGDCICMADDLFVLAVILGLNPECEEFYTAGGEGGAGLWSADQKPSGTVGSGSVTSFRYNCSTHLFFGKDTDQRNIRRFAEIGGGVDPAEIESIVRNLRLYKIGQKSISEVLYVDTRGPYKMLIGP